MKSLYGILAVAFLVSTVGLSPAYAKKTDPAVKAHKAACQKEWVADRDAHPGKPVMKHKAFMAECMARPAPAHAAMHRRHR
jgi:hypothetical protein